MLCILSLYSVLMAAFFEPAASWHQRLEEGLWRLAIAGCVSLASGLLFCLEASTSHADPLWKTLPVQVFLWAAVLLALLFVLTWYLRCGGMNSFGVKLDCS